MVYTFPLLSTAIALTLTSAVPLIDRAQTSAPSAAYLATNATAVPVLVMLETPGPKSKSAVLRRNPAT